MLSVPRYARAAQHHVGLLIIVSGRSKPISPFKVTLLYYYPTLTLTLGYRGWGWLGGADVTPISFFFCNDSRSAGLIAQNFCRTNGESLPAQLFEKKWPGQVRSPSYDVISGMTSDGFFTEVLVSAMWLTRMETLLRDLGNAMTTSGLWHCIGTFWQVIRCHWSWSPPYLPIVAKLAVLCLFKILRPNMQLIFHIELFIRPLYRSRCQSKPSAQFTLCRFFQWEWRRSLPGCYASQTSDPDTTTRQSIQN